MGNGVNAKVDDGFKKLLNRGYQPHFEKYVSKQSVSAEIFHSSTGASSSARIGATVEATVSRKAVLSGAFGLVKAGAKLGLKAVPYVGAAFTKPNAPERTAFLDTWASNVTGTVEADLKPVDTSRTAKDLLEFS